MTSALQVPDTRELVAANDEAQAAFHDMLAAKSYPDPEAAETRAYVAAERIVDRLLAEAQAADLADGDHFAGMPR